MIRFTCILGLLLLSLAPLTWSGEGAADAKAIDGTWLPTAVEMSGQKLPDEGLKSIKLVLKDGNYTVALGEQTDKGTITLDPTKKPKAMDISGTDGPNKGKKFLAIYELSGDTLKVCYDLSGKARPTEFMTLPKSPLFLAVYKREK